MTQLRTALVFVLAALLAACSNGSASVGTTTALTEPQVRAFLDKVEAAAYTEQEDAVMGPAVADDASIVWRTPGEPDESMDKDEYLSDVDGLQDPKYDYEIVEVQVAPGGKSATAKVAATESYGIEGVRYESTYDQDYRIELRDGVPLIVSLVGNETSFAIDGEKQF
jgi:hypothetical protein